MNPFLKKPNFIFDRIINEAEDDDDVAAAPQDNNPDNDNSDQNTETDTNNAEETNDNDEFGSDDDYDINTNLTDEDTGENDITTSTDTDSSADSGSSYDSSTDEEPIKQNTNIFSQLTKEEQDIKISELKKLYNELYVTCDDMLNKINFINPDEDTMIPLSKITSALYSLKQYIGDYIKKLFPIKSYIENDVTYNRYLTIIQSITKIINSISDEVEEKIQKEDKK